MSGGTRRFTATSRRSWTPRFSVGSSVEYADDTSHDVREVITYLEVPDAYDTPPKCLEAAVNVAVACHVPLDLVVPISP